MRRSLSFGFTASFNALLVLQWLLAFHLFTSGEAYPIAQRNSTDIYRRQPTPNPICDIGIPGKTGTKKLRMLGGQDFIAFPNCANNRGFFFDIRNSRVRANTNIARDGRMTLLNRRPPGNVNCDHKVDINILLRAIEQPGGLCEQLNAQGFSPQDIDSELESLRAIINNPSNLVFITDEVERNQKNKVNESFRNGGFVSRAGLTLTPSLQGLAGMDYLERITAESRNTADALDQEINAILGGPPSAQAKTVRQIWDDFLDMARDSKAKTTVQARRELRLAQQQAQQAAARARQCGRPPPTKRSGILYARQGPGRAPTNTAAAPSCPAPGQQTKRVVPADQVQARKRETPAVIATNRDNFTPNPPGPRRAVSRPPNRQKRVPGQAAPRPSTSGRTKPSRKPRAVPKPAGRPAGRPRGRRGRR